MRTLEEVKAARLRVVTDIEKGGLTREQLALLRGMSVALQWVCGEGSTMQEMMDGRQVVRPLSN